MSALEIEAIEPLLAPLKGLRVSRAWSSSLDGVAYMELGKLCPGPGFRYPRGEFTFGSCWWRIEYGGKIEASSWDEDDERTESLGQLEGCTVSRVLVAPAPFAPAAATLQ